MVVEAVRPHRTDGHGESWRLLAANHDQIAEWVTADLTAVKIHELLGRRGVMVPCRTVQRYVFEVCVRSRGRGPTVRVADGGDVNRDWPQCAHWFWPHPEATVGAGGQAVLRRRVRVVRSR